jgi:hypothetical protein
MLRYWHNTFECLLSSALYNKRHSKNVLLHWELSLERNGQSNLEIGLFQTQEMASKFETFSFFGVLQPQFKEKLLVLNSHF